MSGSSLCGGSDPAEDDVDKEVEGHDQNDRDHEDPLHRGHVTYLADAKALGATLIVGVNSDASVRMLGKGDDRPINTEADRMALLAALESVDWVVCFGERTPVELIEALHPDVLVKGGDYDMDALPESALVRGWGGRALAIAFEHDRSTTKLLKKVRAQEGAQG